MDLAIRPRLRMMRPVHRKTLEFVTQETRGDHGNVRQMGAP